MKGKHVLITGHTGFKGSWLTALLYSKGARVSGIALDPLPRGIFEKAEISGLLENDIRQDIRDSRALSEIFHRIQPDVVIHLAAQPLVLASYENPEDTYQTNVIGTLNVLSAIEATNSVQASLIITTDKVYQHRSGESKPFVESDALGAADPYSTSKAMADLLTQSWIASHPGSRMAIVRAGNVIGGGDVAENRLVPDLVNAFEQCELALVRNPDSVRPWQHVLDCLAGYLSLVESLMSGSAKPGAFNFGPNPEAPLSVAEFASISSGLWGPDARWEIQPAKLAKEAQFLTLDSSKSNAVLGWTEALSTYEAISWTINWYKECNQGEDARKLTMNQVSEYCSRN